MMPNELKEYVAMAKTNAALTKKVADLEYKLSRLHLAMDEIEKVTQESRK